MSIILALVCWSVCETTVIKVVDGDTISMNDTVYRVKNIDAPELHGRCHKEALLAREAKRYLSGLLKSGEVTFSPAGTDRFGRTLATFAIDGSDVGSRLVKHGFARKWEKFWDGKKDRWCD